MQCPVDSSTLVMSDRQGIEIDYCPQCRGVWLDRGEIDKIVERSSTTTGVGAAPAQHQPVQQQQQYRDHDDDDRHDAHRGDQRHKRKESWLGDLFD